MCANGVPHQLCLRNVWVNHSEQIWVPEDFSVMDMFKRMVNVLWRGTDTTNKITPAFFFFFWSNNFSLANYLLAFPGSRVLWNRALQEEDYLIIVTGQHYILMINVTMIKSKSLKSYKISQELDFQSLTDLWRTQGLGGLTPRAVRNPHLTSDCPKI